MLLSLLKLIAKKGTRTRKGDVNWPQVGDMNKLRFDLLQIAAGMDMGIDEEEAASQERALEAARALLPEAV